MARKFIQNAPGLHPRKALCQSQGGKKYDGAVPATKKGQSGAHGREQLPQQSQDLQNAQIKAEAAQIFKQTWDECRASHDYKYSKQFEAKYVNDRQYDNLPKAFLREHPFL